MKSWVAFSIVVLAVVLGLALPCAAQTNAVVPKKLLVVSVTKAYRHASIETGLKVVAELAKKDGRFTVDFAGTDAELAAKMTPAALSNYDGVFFLSTTGDLPLPDKGAFLAWIKSGKAFVGAHSATDTFHGAGDTVDPYIDMIGGEFVGHVVAQVECLNVDPQHPATRALGKSWVVTDEIYAHKNFQPTNTHVLLVLNGFPGSAQPGLVPIAAGSQGNVSTALGHDESMWLNPQFQQHLLGGIVWALGLEPGDATPQAH